MMLQDGNGGMDSNQGAGAPGEQKNKFMLALDKVKIFWMVVLSILVLTFVFVFGYWTGQHNASEYKRLATHIEDVGKVANNDSGNSDHELDLDLKEEKVAFDENKDNDLLETKKEDLTDDLLEADDAVREDKVVHKRENRRVRKEKNQRRESVRKSRAESRVVHKRGSKKYIIQLASFSNKKRAMQLRRELLGKGFGGYIIKKGRMYKVRVGNFVSYGKAANTLGKVMRKFRIRDAYIFTKKA